MLFVSGILSLSLLMQRLEAGFVVTVQWVKPALAMQSSHTQSAASMVQIAAAVLLIQLSVPGEAADHGPSV